MTKDCEKKCDKDKTMSPVWTITWGIVLGLIIFTLFIWILALLSYALFGNHVKGMARNWAGGMGQVVYHPPSVSP